MADETNQGVPGAGGQLSGEAAKMAAVKRLRKLQEQGLAHPPKGGAPSVPSVPTGLGK